MTQLIFPPRLWQNEVIICFLPLRVWLAVYSLPQGLYISLKGAISCCFLPFQSIFSPAFCQFGFSLLSLSLFCEENSNDAKDIFMMWLIEKQGKFISLHLLPCWRHNFLWLYLSSLEFFLLFLFNRSYEREMTKKKCLF